MNKFLTMVHEVPPKIKGVSDAGVWGIVLTGWFGLIQPWLTALATVLAITWTCVQLYDWFTRKK